MKLKTSASLMIAVVLGLVTAYVGIDALKNAKGGAPNSAAVVVAVRDMEPGYVVEESDLMLQNIPASLVPAKAFREIAPVAGRTVLASVVKGYPLIDNQLAPLGAGAGMQAMIPNGMRAVAVEVSEGGAVAGLITPGCYVDVIGTFNRGDQQIATTVVQNVKVQFVQRNRPTRYTSSSSSGSPSPTPGSPDGLGTVKTVTLLVTPRQANALELANNQGKPRLVLRGNADDADTSDAMVKQNELLGLPDAPVAQEAVAVEKPVTDAFSDQPPVPVVNKRPVQMIRAGNETTIYFDEDGDRSQEEGSGGAASPGSQKRLPEGVNPRTASGASPGEPAPRSDAGRGTLRKGM